MSINVDEFERNNCYDIKFIRQNHKLQHQQRTNSEHQQNSQQSFQQRSTDTLQTLNEIMSKSKYQYQLTLNQAERTAMPPPSTNAKPMASTEELNAETSPTGSAPNKTKLKVNLSRLDPEHIKRMEHSVSEFAKNSPETAKKIGVIRNETDMFELIKADDRTSKRKNADDGPLCKCRNLCCV